MKLNFDSVKTAVAAQFARMQAHPLFRVDVDKDALWATYLASFPEGSNPIFRERTEHDCSCCKQFIRTVGDVVAVINGKTTCVWDCEPGEPGYRPVVQALAALVGNAPIVEPFLHYEKHAGTDRNFEQLASGAITWSHFYVNIEQNYVQPKAQIPTLLGTLRTQHDVLLRSLTEISEDAIETVLDLIAQNSLYRGEEHKAAVLEFQKLQREFRALKDDHARELYAWTTKTFGSVAHFRNTVIGTLLVDLSRGVELEDAVKSFEAKVAPTNYKRPSALITKTMIANAKIKVEELGLTSALERRYAKLTDIDVNNILFVNRSIFTSALTGNVFEELAEGVGSSARSFDKVEEVPVEKFVNEIVPRVSSIEVLVENRHRGNFVSLLAPSDPTARRLFKWDNGFSWSYSGEVADAIKERVKRAGGNVTGDLCCRLAWHNYDDLDLHLIEPTRNEIYYANSCSSSGGRLDVDMNAGAGTTREPVENIFYASRLMLRHGKYRLFVQQFCRREMTNVGFEAEIDFMGEVYSFVYDKSVNGQVLVADFEYSAEGIRIIEGLPTSQAVRTHWGLPTQTFHPVSVLMVSPNHWGDRPVGNKHYFFMLNGCKNDESARGFYNEFLNEELTAHRKVLEVVGSKVKPVKMKPSESELSGLGFSSTQRNQVVCRVKGSFNRTLKILL